MIAPHRFRSICLSSLRLRLPPRSVRRARVRHPGQLRHPVGKYISMKRNMYLDQDEE